MDDRGPSVSKLGSAMMSLRPWTLSRKEQLSLMNHKNREIISAVLDRPFSG